MVTKYVGVKFTIKEVEAIDCLVKRNQAQSRSDVIRYAVRRYLETVPCLELKEVAV